MQTFTILYSTPQQSSLAPPFASLYDASNEAQARKQCKEENTNATICWVSHGSSIDKAYDEYYDSLAALED